MSLLLKALKRAERAPDGSGSGTGATGDPEWTLQAMEARPATASAGAARGAQAAADFMLARETGLSERGRLTILLGVLVLTVLGMGAYFYVAIFMPWLLVSKPSVAQPPTLSPIVVPSAQPSQLPRTESAATPERAEPVSPVFPAKAIEPAPAAPVAKPAPAAPEAERRNSLHVTRASVPVENDGVLTAYQALQEGRLDQAREAYQRLLAADPRNADVLLGLAVTAQRQRRSEEALQHYLRTLEVEPDNAFAQAGLAGLIGRADPVSVESRLKQLIRQQPAGHLHFALGNLYAGQSRWNEAQSAYFEAQRLTPESADYAFNLAVSLERIGQPRAAVEYYQRALRLAAGKASGFDPAVARARLNKLAQP